MRKANESMISDRKRKLFFVFLCSVVLVFCFKSQNRAIDSLKKILGSKLDDTIRIANLRHLSNEFIDISEYDSVLRYASLGLKLASSVKDSFFVQKFYGRIGVALWNQGKYEDALTNYNIGIKYCRTESERGAYYNNTGLVYWDKGELPKALDYFLRSYDIDKKYNNESGMASSLLNIGLIYDDLRDFKNAIRYYYLALELGRKINDQETIGKCYNNLGKIYSDTKNKNKAMDFYFRALNVSLNAGDKGNVGMVLNNIGCVYLDKEVLDSAIKYLNWSYVTFNKIGDVGGLALVVNNLGHLYIVKKEYNKAIEVLTQAVEVNRMTGNFDDLSVAYRDLSSAYYLKNNLVKAYSYFVKYDRLRDTVIGNQNALLLSDIRKQYDIKEAEKVVNLKREADKKIAATEKRKQTFIIFGVVIILGVVIIFSFFLYSRVVLTQKQKGIIEEQKHVVEEKQKEILDSIHYAKRIQTTIIADKNFIDDNIPANFIYFDPKDIVSGDFYWATKRDHLFYLAICDSTGHGVPGAFMSLLNIGFLSEAVNEKNIARPDDIFNYVRERLVSSISKEGQKDGFDGILVCYDTNTKKFTYAAANNEPILIRNNEIIELEKDKMPVGIGERKEPFRLFEPEIKQGDSFYFYTDGYADQFGGPKGKKFKYKQLNELLVVMCALPLEEQKLLLQNKFKEWKGDLEQVDDVCVIGIKI